MDKKYDIIFFTKSTSTTSRGLLQHTRPPHALMLSCYTQTDIYFIDIKKIQHRLICHRNERDICTCIYKMGNLLKSYDNIHGMTYIFKIMLSGIAIINTGYFNIKANLVVYGHYYNSTLMEDTRTKGLCSLRIQNANIYLL